MVSMRNSQALLSGRLMKRMLYKQEVRLIRIATISFAAAAAALISALCTYAWGDQGP